MEESLVQILSPKRRVDVLRDVMDAKSEGRPYVITFCGVNGVGKSTNLAKVWLLLCSALWILSEPSLSVAAVLKLQYLQFHNCVGTPLLAAVFGCDLQNPKISLCLW